MWNKKHILNYRFQWRGRKYQIYYGSPLWCIATVLAVLGILGTFVTWYIGVVAICTVAG